MSLPNGPACSACALGGCSTSVQGTGFMVSDGEMSSGVLIVGEALGAAEAKQGKALVGPSGFLMGRQMAKRGWRREVFRYSNALYCQPPKNTIRDKSGNYLPWAEEALRYCPYLDEEIDRSKPRVILAFGQTAFEKLTGERLSVQAARGYLFREKKGRCWVIPTFHPAFILRGMNHLALVLGLDMEKAVRMAALSSVEYDAPALLCDPHVSVWEAWCDRAVVAIKEGKPLAADIETPYKSKFAEDEDELVSEEDETWTIDRVSFAVGPDEGVSVMWGMPYLPGIAKVVRTAAEFGRIVIWNRSFDRPRLARALSLTLPIERVRDTMDAWHVLYNCLPKKLGFATSCLPSSDRLPAWKHLSSLEPALYSAMDAVALWRDDFDVMTMLDDNGQRMVYDDICEGIDPVLERMSQAGMMVDVAARDALKVEVSGMMEELTKEMQRAVPVEVRGVKSWKTKKAAEKGLALLKEKGEVGEGEELFALPGEVVETTCGMCGAHPVVKTHVTRKTVEAGDGVEESLRGDAAE